MALNQSLEISLSAISAERQRMELISSNIANVNTTRSIDGGPYKRKIAVLEENLLSFGDELKIAENKMSKNGLGGVVISEIVEDKSPMQKVYNPSHPDADKDGYVQLPNVSLSKEMVDMVEASRLYEANVTAYNIAKKMVQDTLSIQ